MKRSELRKMKDSLKMNILSFDQIIAMSIRGNKELIARTVKKYGKDQSWIKDWLIKQIIRETLREEITKIGFKYENTLTFYFHKDLREKTTKVINAIEQILNDEYGIN